MKSIDTISNFAKFQYIEKYWTKTVPTDIPKDATVSFSLKFDSDEEKDAVQEMEQNLGSEESVIVDFIPEDSFVSDYLGTYNVSENEDSEETEDGKILLSPQSIPDNVNVIAIHYNGEEWENITDVEIRDGYAYGSVTSLSPIAVFATKKDIEVKEGYLWKGFIAVYANGNAVRVFTDEDGKGKIQNKVTGKSYELTNTETVLFGGSSDGTFIDTCDISVEPGVYKKLDIKAGSQSPTVQTSNNNIKVVIRDAEIGCLSGASGCVHTENLEFDLKNVKLSWFGTGESITYLKTGNVDANKGLTPETVGIDSPFYVRKAYVKADNVTTQLAYAGPNTGMTFTKEAKMDVVGGKIDYLLFCASNGKTDKVTGSVDGCKGYIFQTNNRGIVNSADVSIKNSDIPLLFVAGDNTDSTVTGVTNRINIDIDKGTYKLIPGTQSGVEMTTEVAAEVVNKVKYSRSANITFADNTKDVLGSKLVMK